MLNNGIDKTSLGYLGDDYQYKLVKEFMEDKSCFKDLAPIIDQNMFTASYLRDYVGTMLDYYKTHGDVPSYSSMAIEMHQKAHTQIDIELADGVLNKIKNTPSDGSEQTRILATKFFKQQNIIKAANEMLKLAGAGDLENYDKCEDLLKAALSTGNHEDYEESRLFDGMEEALSKDARVVIPTGIGKIDETLNGGIGKGELGVIVGPSGYGKVQPYDSKIVTPNGLVMMKDIQVGSLVIGNDGKPHTVTQVFPHKDWEFYKIIFSDGSQAECGKEHLWNINQEGVDDDDIYHTMSLEDIMKLDGKVSIPMTKPVEFEEKSSIIDLYTLGKLIGRTINQDTYISQPYLINTINNRKALLNGIMDVRGVYNEEGYYEIATKSKKRLYSIKQLIWSLGGTTHIVDGGNNFLLKFCFQDPNFSVFRYNKRQSSKISKLIPAKRYIQSIEYSRKADGQCIMIDSDDHLYLTDDYIVTHNTTITTSMALTAARYKSQQNDYKGFKVLQIVFEDRIKQIQRKHFSKITQVEACNLSKEEYAAHVKEILSHYEDKDLIQENLRIIRLKSGEKSVDWIIDLIKKHINQGFRPDLVFIDYFECIKLTGSSTMSKWDKESAIMRKIEAAANELNIAFWVPVQGNRDSINAELVTMDNAGGSLGKIQIAHIIMSITRSLEDIADNVATMSILKNRAGSSGVVIDGAVFNNGTCTISTDSVTEYDSGVAFNKHREEIEEQDKLDLLREVHKSAQQKNK